MDLERLNAFLAVASEGSFSGAARKIFKTQPAVSQSVAALERELGQRLLVRGGGRVELTQAGELLFGFARRALHILGRGKAELEALKGLQTGKLTIGASDTTACYIMPPWLRAFRRRYPGVEIVLSNRTSPAVARQVLGHEVDFGIVTLPVQHPRLQVEEIAVREDVLICPPNHPLARRKRVRLAEMQPYSFILLDRGSSTRRFIDEQFDRAGISPKPAMEVAGIEVMKKLVELGFGLSIVPYVAVREEVSRKTLRAVSIFRKSEARKLGVIHLKREPPSPAARAFLEVMRGSAGKK